MRDLNFPVWLKNHTENSKKNLTKLPYADLGLQTGTIVFESMPQIFLVEATFYNIEQTQNLKQIDMIFFDMFSVC